MENEMTTVTPYDAEARDQYWVTFDVQRGLTDQIQKILSVIQGRAYIAGSYAAWMGALSFETLLIPGDIDIFATSQIRASAIYQELCEALGYGWYDETDVAITLWPGSEALKANPDAKTIQIVKPNPLWTDFPGDIIRSFDFDICRAALLDEKHVLADTNIGMPRAKILAINNPFRSLKRALKYHKRGIEFPDEELIKLFKAWDATSPERKAALIERTIPEPDYGPDDRYDFSEDEYFDGE